MNKIADYFSLWTWLPAAGKSAEETGVTKVRQPFLFSGVLVGAICKVIYDSAIGDAEFAWASLLVASIGAVVCFPAIYSRSGLNRAKLTLAKWCLAFQYGFFWQFFIEALTNQFGK